MNVVQGLGFRLYTCVILRAVVQPFGLVGAAEEVVLLAPDMPIVQLERDPVMEMWLVSRANRVLQTHVGIQSSVVELTLPASCCRCAAAAPALALRATSTGSVAPHPQPCITLKAFGAVRCVLAD